MSDIEIARKSTILDIRTIAEKIGLCESDLILYGNNKAKIRMCNNKTNNGKLILVTAINPTPYGEGKTTVSIGLADALNILNKKATVVLREPSMGPVFGIKGGATGGGYSQVIPMDEINLHFTGDFHAITAANDLLCAAIDNHIFQGNKLDIQKVVFKRCLDVNDRALRRIKLESRDDFFSITAASEIMALFCLSDSLDDLKERLANIVVGYNSCNEMIYARDLKIEGALTVILKDAFLPNLVQTLEHTPAIIHGGPFANIAHGCNSVVATKFAMSVSDYVVTEAGFGADLGAEKFFDIKCRSNNIKPDCVVLVATIKALKYNGAFENNNKLSEDQLLTNGLSNLGRHIDNLKKFGVNIVVCLNKFDSDTEREIETVKKFCCGYNVFCEVCTSYEKGGRGAIELAKQVILNSDDNNFKLLYNDDLSIVEKIKTVCMEIYRASTINFSDEALENISYLESHGKSYLPICVAKTQYSFSDNPKLLGAPANFSINVKDVILYNGAGFITVFLGNIMTMPGLSKTPNYEKIDLINGEIVGIS